MTVTVYNEKIEEVLKRLEAVRKKAEKYGSSFSYEIGEPYAAEIKIMGIDHATSISYVKDTVRVEAVDVRYDDEMVRKDGWTAVAKVEHLDDGNLVTTFDGSGYPEAWHTVAPYCEHCRTNHQRTVTYMVQNVDGVIRQVGSSCLHDYTGIDPRLAVSFAALRNYLDEDAGVGCETYERSGASRLMNVESVIALACEAVKKFGYRKSDYPGSTKEWVLEHYRAYDFSKESEKEASRIVDWIKNNEHEAFSYAWESKPLVVGGWCKAEHVGRLVWLPVAWEKELERIEREARWNAERDKEAHESEYVGEVGKKITVEVASAKLLSSWENQWGTTFLYKFIDVSGNVLIWFASGSQDIDGVKKLTGTVKDHNERDGVKQTIVTRCKLTVEKSQKSVSEDPRKAIDDWYSYFEGGTGVA